MDKVSDYKLSFVCNLIDELILIQIAGFWRTKVQTLHPSFIFIDSNGCWIELNFTLTTNSPARLPLLLKADSGSTVSFRAKIFGPEEQLWPHSIDWYLKYLASIYHKVIITQSFYSFIFN